MAKEIELNKRRKKEQVRHMLAYASLNTGCRQNWILNYFGEQTDGHCGNCDLCLPAKARKDQPELVAAAIRNALQGNPGTSREIVNRVPFEDRLTIKVLQMLLEEGLLTINHKNQYSLK